MLRLLRLVVFLSLGYGATAKAQDLNLTKEADKRVASTGDVVTYTLSLENTQADRNDLTIVDLAPRGFVFIDGSARAEMISAQGVVQPFGQIGTPDAGQTRGGMIEFGP